MADIDHLFGGTSLSTRPPGATPAASEALGVALLTGILTDIAFLKEGILGQREVNGNLKQWVEDAAASTAAQQRCNAAFGKALETLDAVAEQVNKFGAILEELESRLHALDGKRSIVLSPSPANVNDPEVPTR